MVNKDNDIWLHSITVSAKWKSIYVAFTTMSGKDHQALN